MAKRSGDLLRGAATTAGTSGSGGTGDDRPRDKDSYGGKHKKKKSFLSEIFRVRRLNGVRGVCEAKQAR